MVDEHVGGGEVVRSIAEKHTEPILKKVTNVASNPLLVKIMIMALAFRQGSRYLTIW
jgi:hypothetical protein